MEYIGIYLKIINKAYPPKTTEHHWEKLKKT